MITLPTYDTDATARMDITSFVTERRDKAFLLGDYNFYRGQLSRQLLTLRKKLKIATQKNAKYSARALLNAEAVAENREYGR